MPPVNPSTALNTNPAGMIIGGTLGLAQTVSSLINAGKTKEIAKQLERSRPKREISPLYGQNLSLAESELAGGMSTAAERAYASQLDKSTAASLSALLKGGGDVNSVGDVFASGEEGRQRLAMLNDQLRLNQINNVVKARGMMAEEADKNFLFNDYAPWADKSQANAEARKAANAGIWSGLSTVAGAGMNYFSNKLPKMPGMEGLGGGVDSSAMMGRPGADTTMASLLMPRPSGATPNFNPSVEALQLEDETYMTNPYYWKGGYNY